MTPANLFASTFRSNPVVPDPGASQVISLQGLSQCQVNLVSATGETRTLLAPSRSQQMVLVNLKTDGGDVTLTVKDSASVTSDTYVFDDAGDFVLLAGIDVGGVLTWVEIASRGVGGGGSSFDEMTINSTLTMATADISFVGVGDILVTANTAAALEISDGTTKLVAFDTRSTVKDVANVKINPIAPTIATEAAAHLNPSLQIAAKTVTYTGTATVTSSHGVGLHIGIPTFTDASAGTLSLASNVYVAAVAAAGGSLTLTAARMIATGVSDCYLTNAGVWTDTACWEYGKEMVNRSLWDAYHAIEDVLEKIVPATWKYRDTFEYIDAETQQPMLMGMDDRGRERVGIVYDDLPGELRAPGEERGVSPGILASFCLAAVKMLADKNRDLEARLVALGG